MDRGHSPQLIHAEAPLAALAVVRALVFSMWAVKLMLDPLEQLAELPRVAFRPPAPLLYLPESVQALWLDFAFLLALRWGTAGLLLLGATGRWFLAVAPISCILLTGYQSGVRGFSKLNHAEIVPLLSVYALTLFAWADYLQGVRRPAAPIVTMATLLCVSYWLTGVYRLTHAGMDSFLTNTMEQFAVENALRTTYYTFGYGRHVLDYPFLAVVLRLGFVAVTLAELAAPFCLVDRRIRILFLMVMVPFHVMTLFLMNIAFFENSAMLLLLVVDTSRWAKPPAATAQNTPLTQPGQ